MGTLFSCHWFNQLGVNKALKLIYFTLRPISRRVMLLKGILRLVWKSKAIVQHLMMIQFDLIEEVMLCC